MYGVVYCRLATHITTLKLLLLRDELSFCFFFFTFSFYSPVLSNRSFVFLFYISISFEFHRPFSNVVHLHFVAVVHCSLLSYRLIQIPPFTLFFPLLNCEHFNNIHTTFSAPNIRDIFFSRILSPRHRKDRTLSQPFLITLSFRSVLSATLFRVNLFLYNRKFKE